MRIFAFSFLLLGALLSPSDAYAHKLEEWQTKNFNISNDEKTAEKKVSAKEISRLQAEIEEGVSQKAIPPDLLDKYYLRDRMLKQLLIQRPIIGLNKAQVSILFSDCKSIPPGTLRNAQTRVFLIYDASSFPPEKETRNERERRSSLCLEVRFFKNVAYAFRIKLEKFKKRAQIDTAAIYKEPFDSMWKMKWFTGMMLQAIVSQDAEKAGITEDSVERECYVTFKVTNRGDAYDIAIAQSSLNQKFDGLVIEAVKKLSGKPGMRLPQGTETQQFRYPIHLEVMESREKDSSGKSLEKN